MNKFVTGALALAATSSVGLADPSDSSEWLELDSEINGLASSYSSSSDLMGWAALIRATFTYSSDDIATAGGKDISGFKFEDVKLAFWGGYGDYSYRISGDLAGDDGLADDGDIHLEDAYADWDCGEYFTARMGQFKPYLSVQGSMAYENLLFIDRTPLGAALDYYDLGIGAMGSYEMFNWAASIANGATGGQEAGHGYALRAEYVMGTGAFQGGALGANDDLNGVIGVSYYRDETLGATGDRDAAGYLFDLQGTAGPIGFGGEIASLTESLADALSTGSDFGRGANFPLSFANDDDTTPFSLWGSYLLNQEFEGGLRYDSMDNVDDITIISLVVNWYLSGHNAKWQAQFSNYDSDGDDGSIFQVGLVVGATG